MSDIFDKIASDFISEKTSAPSNNGDIFDKIASDFISKRASSLSQPLRSSYDYGERHANSFLDMDEDGDLDCLVGDADGKVHYLRNDGGPTSPYWSYITRDFFESDES